MQFEPELVFIRTTVTWRFWAFGYHTYRTRHTGTPGSSWEVLCIAFGPVRWHFARLGSNWKPAEVAS